MPIVERFVHFEIPPDAPPATGASPLVARNRAGDEIGRDVDQLDESSQRRNTSAALCPPKPNEFDTATLIPGAWRASFGM